MLKIELDTSLARKALSDLATKQVPFALSLATNTLSKEIIGHESALMRSVFDRPTPFAESGLRIKKVATKADPAAEIGFKDVFGRMGDAVESALAPHIPGYPSERRQKGMERWLKARGFMDEGEWLVPSRTMRLDRFGNVPGSVASKMLADVGAYNAIRNPGARVTTKAGKGRYIFGEVNARKGGTVKGIWQVQGGREKYATGRWKLQMVVVKKRPTYRKRFDFYGEAERFAARNYAKHLVAAMDRAVQTARR
jgi:hypothetical protein